ncbi:MAG: Uma2 family endonuclease [Phormidesmis sp.]
MTSSYIRQSFIHEALPSTADLPCSDDIPVDNEDQNLLPNLLLLLLTHLWADRFDWFFGVDMAVYHTTGISPRVPAVPDAFLSLGVERVKGGKTRSSYAVWEEQGIAPIFALEVVSQTPGGEYDEKRNLYAKLGVLYYIIYNPKYWRQGEHQRFEVYKLEADSYQLQQGEPYWMPEIGLGIGRYETQLGNLSREILTWYDEQGTRHFSEAEQMQVRADQEQRRADQEQGRADRAESLWQQERARREQLEKILRAQGIDPDDL